MADNFRPIAGFDTPSPIYRSGALAPWDNSEGAYRLLEEHGIQTILDLRRPQEYQAKFHEILDYRKRLHHLGINILNYPFGDLDDLGVDRYDGYKFSAEEHNLYYEWIVHHQFYVFKDILRLIHLSPKPVLIHCSAGRDRTGMVAAVLETLLEIDQELIYDSYTRSHGASRKNLEVFFAAIEDKGGLVPILLDIGFTNEEITDLRNMINIKHTD